MFVQYQAQMNAPLLPEVIRRLEASPQDALPLATEGVQRYVWEGRYGAMLIEVIDGIAYVNGSKVEPLPGSEKANSP